MDERKEGKMDITDEWKGRWLEGYMAGWTDRRVSGWVNGWLGRWMNE